MPKKASTILFYLIAVWCVAVGLVNQTFNGVADLAWVAKALEGTNVSAFDPILAIWAHWIGMFLITAGIVLFVLIPDIHGSRRSLGAAAILAIGSVSAQCFSVLSLGAFGPIVFVLIAVVACAVTALVLAVLNIRQVASNSL